MQLSTNNTQLTSLFAYDGFGRRVQIIEVQNGVIVGTNKFVWCGTELCEQRDSTGGAVTKRFFGQGEQISGVNYFFTRDHLGSIREMTDAAGTIHARYDYDPYGQKIKIQSDLDADFGYAGYYVHQPSGMYLTLFRTYDSDLGRWLSRDPMGEAVGLNLYGYVRNDPINTEDPLGDTPPYGGVGVVNAALNLPTFYYNYESAQSLTEGANFQVRQAESHDGAFGLALGADYVEAAWVHAAPAIVSLGPGATGITGGASTTPGVSAGNPFASPKNSPEAVQTGIGIAEGYDSNATSGFFSGIYSRFHNWWKKSHPKITKIWKCKNDKITSLKASPTSPGPGWELEKTIVQ